MKLLITTVVDHNYQAYIPLFIYCAKKAYPEYDVRVFFRDILPDELGVLIDESYLWHLRGFPNNKATTSSLRFVWHDTFMRNYDYCFITDVDILMYRETEPLHEQHLKVMKRAGLECYENIAVKHQKYGNRMPGVLFATKEWVERTREAREKYSEYLLNPDSANYYEHDEVMLYNICKESGLPITFKGTENWRHHGIHFGKYRKNHHIKLRLQEEVKFIKELSSDNEFLRLLEICGNYRPEVIDIFNDLREAANGQRY
jgi:hypothetical protein